MGANIRSAHGPTPLIQFLDPHQELDPSLQKILVPRLVVYYVAPVASSLVIVGISHQITRSPCHATWFLFMETTPLQTMCFQYFTIWPNMVAVTRQ
jgi:hypothetical protein